MPTKPRFDIGIVVPLPEELQYVVEVAPIVSSISRNGAHFHVLDFGPYTAIACLIGEMGLLAAQHATQRLLDYADLRLLVLLGTAGGLDEDLAVGDVALGTEINEYLANSRAETAGGGYELRYSGRHWPLEYRIRQALGNFEFGARTAYERWAQGAEDLYRQLDIPDKPETCTPPPGIRCGKIASGTVVAASKAFADELKGIDRKFIAIDMEAAGFAYAASERIRPVPHLVMRGISDRSDENKKKLDKTSKNGWRRYCVRNAATLLKGLLEWDGFRDAVGIVNSAGERQSGTSVRDLVTAVRDRLGGAWAVGLALGICTQGPAVVASGNAIAVDVSRLRASDARFRSMIESIESHVDASGSFAVDVAADAVLEAVDRYRNRLANADADALIADFDAVVVEIVFAEEEPAESTAALLLVEADRLAEDVGPHAVVDLLKDHIGEGPLVRERYVNALAETGAADRIVQLAESVGTANLTRAELEHAMFACPGQGREDLAKELWRRHVSEFVDAAAVLTRKQLVSRFPAFGKYRT
ncbi:hypothetical protein [Bradyrhizobium sp. HKCCYLR20261]|uniref:5'-methylthioadenosine/S-adenosylhomocysteine nucleosidase family protein n=1 Tax=Bradyrhizobium sp. HKCCYLR20261 TaxID=3420760 RepID=UPI003EBCC4AC